MSSSSNHEYDADYSVKEKGDLTTVVSQAAGETIIVEQPFNLLSALGIAYSITNSSLGIYLSMGSQIYFGGPPAYIYGYIFMAFVGFCAAVSLGELSSLYPHAGGQYHWVTRLCPPKSRRLLSYVTAILAWAGAVATGAGTVLSCAQIILGMAKLTHRAFAVQEKPWMVFLIYQAVNLIVFPANCFEKSLPHFARFALFMAIAMLVIINISVLAASPSKQPAKFVFVDYYNASGIMLSGWNSGVCFFIGLNTPNWSFSCLDAATHLADELPDPRRTVPRTLLLTVLLGFVTGLFTLIAMYFSLQSVHDAIDGVSGIFAMELFRQAFSGKKAAALALESIILTSGFLAVMGIHTWQSRMAWAFARDKGFPFHKHMARIAPPPFGSPFVAHLWSASWTAVCGCLYLASVTAFSSLISAGILLQYLTYSISVALLLLKGRSNISPGPFWYPRLGLLCNIVVLVWTGAALVFYSLPYFRPVLASEMNYVSVVLVVVVLYAFGYWIFVGRKSYKVPTDADNSM